ncbi:MAG TPA: PilZ domain-containing protein [Anaeromyxobacteraceae bacterium]|nr:PilZ domain-containing protein [Anaeromyxobacteraceae bacterium]
MKQGDRPTQEPEAKEARACARYRRRYRVLLTGHPSAFTVDVGAGGFCTELMRVLPPGTPVAGSLHVKGAEVSFAGRVAWARPGEARMNLRGRMGVSFTRVQDGFERLVETP